MGPTATALCQAQLGLLATQSNAVALELEQNILLTHKIDTEFKISHEHILLWGIASESGVYTHFDM